MAQSKTARIDPTSGDVVLAYAGGRVPPNVPARDLNGVDIARIAYRRALNDIHRSRSNRIEPGETRKPIERPGEPDYEALVAIADELLASGAFTNPTPAAPVTNGGPA